MVTIVKGSIEFILISVEDRLEVLSDLSGVTPTFTVYEEDGTPTALVDVAADTDEMIAKCLVDSTDLDTATYELYLTLHGADDTPILGPYKFVVEEIGTT